MKKYFVIILISFFCCNNKEQTTTSSIDIDYSAKHKEALNFVKANGMNQDFYYLLDYSIHSGKYRFFIYDFKKNTIVDKGLVTHGSCDQLESNPDMWEKAKFSNQNESHCSSIGKYKIGKRDYSSWGINVKYWLKGLESTNKNAEKRVVVLHSWSAVKNEECFPKYSPLSWGCPAVSDTFMDKIDSQLKKTTVPVLLWIVQ